MSIFITLDSDLDVKRGDMFVKLYNKPKISQNIEVMLCWLSSENLNLQKKYILRHTTKETKCEIKRIRYKVDINTLNKKSKQVTLGLNDIGRVQIGTNTALYYDSYNRNRQTGSIIIIDAETFQTVAAGMII